MTTSIDRLDALLLKIGGGTGRNFAEYSELIDAAADVVSEARRAGPRRTESTGGSRNITPDQAHELMENHVEPYEMPDLPDAVELWESAWDLAQTVADLHWEWGVEPPTGRTEWFESRTLAEARMPHPQGCRLVLRLVGPVEAVE